VRAGAEVAAERGWPFVLNPAPARTLPPEVLPRSAVVVANRIEAGMLGSVESILESGAGAVVVTRGEEGADLHRPGLPPHHQPSFRVAVADATGAGDAFVATLALALLEDRPLEDGVRLGAAAGALACREVGARAGLPDRAELDRFASHQG
jgi:ribokinase